MARRGGGTMAAAALLAVAAVILIAGVASAAAAGLPKTTKAAGLKPGQKPSPRSKFVTLKPNRFGHKRNYQVSCSDEGGPVCYVGCPKECPNKCLVFCAYCLSFCMCDIFPGTSCGDPRFTGGDGNTFYFHGNKDKNFCIVSDAELHINAHFIGNHNPELKRDFTWVQALGVTFAGDHRLYVGARRAAVWDEDEDHIQITLDGEPIEVEPAKNARWVSTTTLRPQLSVKRMDAVNTVMVELDGVFTISANAVPITDADNRVHHYGRKEGDSLVHLDLGFQLHNLTKDVDGVLGQTYRPGYVSNVDIKAKMPIMGGAPKYLASGLFSTDCAVSRFFHRADVITTFAS